MQKTVRRYLVSKGRTFSIIRLVEMQIIDLTQVYLDTNKKGKELVNYLDSYPNFFNYYFEYWGNKQKAFVKLSEDDVERRVELIKTSCVKIETLLASQKVITSQIEVILFVGQHLTNGHAFLVNKKSIAFLAIEHYDSSTYADVFCAHEIAHALQYSFNPEFYFNSETEKEQFSRMLITEGLATYLTKELLDFSDTKALWADYLSESDALNWINNCHLQSKDLFQYCYNKLDSNTPDPIFYVGNINDPFQSRAGYWVGLKFIESIVDVHHSSLNDLLKISKAQMEILIRGFLKTNLVIH